MAVGGVGRTLSRIRSSIGVAEAIFAETEKRRRGRRPGRVRGSIGGAVIQLERRNWQRKRKRGGRRNEGIEGRRTSVIGEKRSRKVA